MPRKSVRYFRLGASRTVYRVIGALRIEAKFPTGQTRRSSRYKEISDILDDELMVEISSEEANW